MVWRGLGRVGMDHMLPCTPKMAQNVLVVGGQAGVPLAVCHNLPCVEVAIAPFLDGPGALWAVAWAWACLRVGWAGQGEHGVPLALVPVALAAWGAGITQSDLLVISFPNGCGAGTDDLATTLSRCKLSCCEKRKKMGS